MLTIIETKKSIFFFSPCLCATLAWLFQTCLTTSILGWSLRTITRSHWLLVWRIIISLTTTACAMELITSSFRVLNWKRNKLWIHLFPLSWRAIWRGWRLSRAEMNFLYYFTVIFIYFWSRSIWWTWFWSVEDGCNFYKTIKRIFSVSCVVITISISTTSCQIILLLAFNN